MVQDQQMELVFAEQELMATIAITMAQQLAIAVLERYQKLPSHHPNRHYQSKAVVAVQLLEHY